MSDASGHDAWADARVLVTGGLGFLGSNLALRLVELNAQVTLLDAQVPGSGANLRNLDPLERRVTLISGDVNNAETAARAVQGHDFVFHLAGQVDHVQGMSDPLPDVDTNIRGTAVMLEACRRHAPRARFVYSGTRGQYGKAERLPVAETHPLRPIGIHEVTKQAGEQLVEAYGRLHGLPTVRLRITNVYGPRAQMQHARFCVVNWFVRQALEEGPITIFGDGSIRRDFLYVDDSVEAMLRCATCPAALGEVFNVGTGASQTLLELAQAIVESAGQGRVELVPFSEERRAQEPGDFYCDVSKMTRVVGWESRVGLEVGLAATLKFYRDRRADYW